MMREQLAAAAVDLFEGYGMDVERRPSAEAPGDTQGVFAVSAIGFSADKLRGALVLVAATPAVLAWRCAIDGGHEVTDICDTIGEFSNMLLGRLKGKLLPEGLSIHVSTPTTALAQNLSLAPSGAISTWLIFDGPTWHVAVRLHASFDDGFRLHRNELAGAPAEAGDMLIF